MNLINIGRFDTKLYRIFSQPLSLASSFEHEQNGPVRENLNYKMLAEGNPLLSPYTLWTFQIYHMVSGATFDELKAFASEDISLVLTGYGTYVTNWAGQATTRQLDRFYKAMQI